jgi:hypothetical protein
MRMRFSEGVDYNKVNEEILNKLDIKKGDKLFFVHTGKEVIADFRRGVGWYFQGGAHYNFYEGTDIKYWLNKNLAVLTRV